MRRGALSINKRLLPTATALVREVEAIRPTMDDKRVITHLKAGMAAIAAQGHEEIEDTVVRECIVARLAKTTDRNLCPYTQVTTFDRSPDALLAAVKGEAKLVAWLESLLARLNSKGDL